MLHILHASIFLLDANMKLVLPFRLLVIIQSMWVLTWSALLQVTSLPTSILEMAAAVTVKTVAAVTVKTAVIMETAAAVYRRGHWFISSVSEVRSM
jgi:hypothetical protein